MAAMSRSAVTQGKLTYQDYCRIPEDGQRHEILDGTHFVSPSPGLRHQQVSVQLTRILAAFLRETRLGELLQAPSDVILDESTVVQPDHYVVLRSNVARLEPDGCHGPPDLVIEVLSPGNAAHDLVRKLALYDRMGVAEYWVVDPATRRVEVYRRESSGGTSRSRVAKAGTGHHSPRFARPLVLMASRGDRLETPLLPGLAASLAEVFDTGLAGEGGTEADDPE